MARKVEGLATWQLCNELVEKLIAATEGGRVATDCRFCEQVNDAAADALSDIAEGFTRFNPAEFARFLDYALSSLEEVRTRVANGHKRKYLSDSTTSDLLSLTLRTETAARNLRAYLWSVDKKDLPKRPNPTRRKRDRER
jgi:four helix bundle protein